jgi:hypothetical protein
VSGRNHTGLGQETGPSDQQGGLGQETGPSDQQGGLGQETGPSGGDGVFRVKPGFQFFYTLPVLLALAIFVDALLAPAADKWLFLLLVLILAAISVPRGWSKVTLEDGHLTLHTLLRRPRPVDLRHLAAVETSPRIGQALVLRYHPVDEHGRPDLQSEAILGLPPLEDQARLEDILRSNHVVPIF